ncbi:hypothetical protein M9H77_28146 [Catharanthus roseus]|uniref:Uncharacterized protein n=1 Tax=Catharanthus roseus TaxID=4058 RepID=A0ACC0AEJ5_CATRO|nr:hypothetical protein M9H77_28146 [Catharanthus roseus]
MHPSSQCDVRQKEASYPPLWVCSTDERTTPRIVAPSNVEAPVWRFRSGTLSPRSLGKQESQVFLSSSPSLLSLKYSPEIMVKKTTRENRSQQGSVAEKDRRSERSSGTGTAKKKRERKKR